MAVKLAIPETAAEMQEMMSDPKIAAQIIQSGDLANWVEAYAKKTDQRGELAELVRDSVAAAMAGENEISNQVKDTMRDEFSKLLQEHGAPVNRPRQETSTINLMSYNKLAPGSVIDEIGFANIGDFTRVAMEKTGRADDRLAKLDEAMGRIKNAYSSVEPSAGGALIPETMRAEIEALVLEGSIVRPLATVIQMSSLTQLIPFVDHTTNIGSVFGGMTFTWVPESGEIETSEARFGRVKLEANKLAGAAGVPNELWNDATALSSFLMNALPTGIRFYEDVAFLSGTGAGQPLGVLNSPARVVIDVAAQTADTIITENVLEMYARMLPTSLGRAVWLANPTTFSQLMLLTVDVGTGGAPISLVNINAGPPMTLLGRPLILTEKVPALGLEGDLAFVDLSYYLIGDRQAISVESSEHSRFRYDETELRVIERVDGRPWIQSAFQPLNGDTISPFVVLSERAGS